MPIPGDEAVTERTRRPQPPQVQYEADELPHPAATSHCARYAATAAVGEPTLDQIRSCLRVIDGQPERREIAELLERRKSDVGADALLQPTGPFPAESAVAVIDEQCVNARVGSSPDWAHLSRRRHHCSV